MSETNPKLNLNTEEREIFLKAINAAYDAGKQNSAFLMGGTPELITSQKEEIDKIVTNYLGE